ncbi:ATP-binding protein [Orrella daihaiensis]|uniref:ATP-binding protein n=1 Tax=Orrella daihaiensis TaxID=2782176 RepID=A0ABY4APF7_9BURK|nr:AAA family ATPase [Orrella daihaiensis]UOD51275.1 ATP-binding protein [Orrella daihaiensis]
MRRHLTEELKAWRAKAQRLPLLIDGARQTGKTYLLTTLFAKQFARFLHIDFLERPEFASAFEGALTPTKVLANLQLLSGQSFDPKTDLLILDEIGECPRAVTSLKYFAEQMPEAFVVASGSNIGLLNSFPVGKVEQHNLRPLSFHEFLIASGQTMLVDAFEAQNRSKVAHDLLMQQLVDYYFTGGMPAAVNAWFGTDELKVLERIQAVSRIHADLIAGYQKDFGKYAGRTNAQLIDAVFKQIPAQISSVVDDSVKRFRFKDVHPPKTRYADFESAINWLHHCRLVLLNYPIEGQPRLPLVAYRKPSRVKLFLFDVGLLNHMLGTTYQQIKQQAYEYKGFIAENFVQQELAVLGVEPTYAWTASNAEIEFLLTDNLGHIVPVEVKSGARRRAKSLASYIERYQPTKTVKLSALANETRAALSQSLPTNPTATTSLHLPLYDVAFLPKLIGMGFI